MNQNRAKAGCWVWVDAERWDPGAPVGTGLPGARDSLTWRLVTQCPLPFCALIFLPAG